VAPSSILHQELARLRKLHAKPRRWALNILCLGFILFYFVIGGLNLKLAERFALADGMSLSSIVAEYLDGVDVRKTYSGLAVKARERVATAFLFSGAGLITICLYLSFLHSSKRQRLLLDALEKSNLESD
jgi:hypothetical protein